MLPTYLTLIDIVPNHTNGSIHLQFIQSIDKEHYINTLSQIFAAQSAGLNGIDLEGNGNIGNTSQATHLIHAS